MKKEIKKIKFWQKYPIFTLVYLIIALTSPIWLIPIIGDFTPIIWIFMLLLSIIIMDFETDFYVFKRLINKVKRTR
jgi:hypothetical protein